MVRDNGKGTRHRVSSHLLHKLLIQNLPDGEEFDDSTRSFVEGAASAISVAPDVALFKAVAAVDHPRVERR